MKKRIFSFVIIVVIAVAALISFGVPTIIEKGKVGMEYNGGFDILYEVKTNASELDDKNLANAAKQGIEKRLDISNVLDPVISVEGEKYVRVTVSASNQLVADDIREIIESSSEITFRDASNNLMATGEEILEDVGASLSDQTDANGYPVILLHIKNTELLAEITEEISALDDKHLVVWLGFEEGDDYANLSTDASVAKKIIYNATVSEKLDTDTITITGSFTKSAAQSTVDLINSETADYELDVLQITSIPASYAESSFNKVLIAGLVAMILVVIGLCAYYKIGGAVSAVAVLFNTFITILLFVTFKGVINQQFIAAMIVTLGISVDAVVIVLERVKTEQYNGKNLSRAVNEGFKKSTTAILDTSVVVLLMSLVMYFLGTNIANFAMLLSLSSVSTLIIMTVIYKLFMSLAVRLNLKSTACGAKKAYLENKELYLNNKVNTVNPLNNKKNFFLGTGVFTGVAVVVMLILQLVMGSMFNYNNTIKKNSNVTIVTTDKYFTNEEHVLEFFDKDLNIKAKDIDMSTYEENGVTKYKVYISTDDSIIDVEDELTNKLINTVGENKEYDEKYELYINDVNPKATGVSLLSVLYTAGIGLLVIGLYLGIRYRYSYAIAAIMSTLFTLVVTALFFGLTRIKVGSDALIAIYALVVYSNTTLIVMFSRLKEMLKDMKRKYVSNEEREMALVKSINVSLSRTIISTIVVTVVSVVLLAFASLTNYSFYITLIIGFILSSISAIMVATLVWSLFEGYSDKKKREFKPKKKNTKFKELEETTIIGIND